MLCGAHFGNQIGRLDQRRLGIAASDHDMQVRATRLQRGHYLLYVEIVVAQSNIEFVEHDKADGRVGHEFEGFRPGGFRSEEHTSELQSREKLVCRLLLEKKK